MVYLTKIGPLQFHKKGDKLVVLRDKDDSFSRSWDWEEVVEEQYEQVCDEHPYPEVQD
jgi:hypothetical protein